MKIIIQIYLLFLIINIKAQNTFQKTYGEVMTQPLLSMDATSDGGFILAGTTTPARGSGGLDMLLIRTDSLGHVIWQKTFGTSIQELGYSVKQTRDGGFIAVGASGTQPCCGPPLYDVYVVRTDGSGNLLWSKTIGGADYDAGYSVRETSDGSIVICGETSSFNARWHAYMLKLASDGTLQWTKTFGITQNGSSAADLLETSDKGFILAGMTAKADNSGGDFYVIKTDSSGNMQWNRIYGGPNDNEAHSICQTHDGGFVIVGETQSFGPNGFNMYAVKIKSNGDTAWTKTFGGNSIDVAYGVSITKDSGFIIVGHSSSFWQNPTTYLVKIDSTGKLGWSKTYGDQYPGAGYAVRETRYGYIICGSKSNGTADQLCLIQTDSLGNAGCNTQSPSTNVGSGGGISSGGIQGGGGIENDYPVQVLSYSQENSLCPTNVAIASTSTNKKNLLIYPDPSSGKFTISGVSGDSEIKVYDSFGQLVVSKNHFDKVAEIDISNQAQGVYFVYVISKTSVETQKIAIQ